MEKAQSRDQCQRDRETSSHYPNRFEQPIGISRGTKTRTTLNGMKMVTKDTADYWAIMRHFDARRIPFYTSHSNSLKLARTIIQQLPGDTPVKDSANESVALGYSVISAPQMTATRP